MKDYGKMSDFEINKAVATALGMDVSGATEENNIMYGYVPDICNNPSYAWPIMKDNLIGFTPDEDGVTHHFYGDWTATVHCKNIQHTDKNPYRAAMIVYLMMKDEDQ